MRKVFCLLLIVWALPALAQENLSYQKPPQEILELVDVQLPPFVLVDDKKETMILLYRDAYKTIAELSEQELRLGGLRINPQTQIGSRVRFYNDVKLIQLKNGNEVVPVSGLPEQARLANFSWSPDQKKIALTNTTSQGTEVWVLDLERARVSQMTEARVNANMGDVINWFADSQSFLVKMIPNQRQELIDASQAVPTGPTISENTKGVKAQNRTYQDLLKNKVDEHNFEQLAHSEIVKVSLEGSQEKWMESAMYRSISFSPDGQYVMVTTVEKPFSYLVPYYRFPSKTNVYTQNGQKVKTILDVPLIEDLPKGFMAVRKGMRNINWRDDKPATLVFAEALDGGDPAKEVEYRDEVSQWDAPFSDSPQKLFKTHNRMSRIVWGNDNRAIAYDSWFDTRNTKTYLFNPSQANEKAVVLFDRSSQDRYSNPGYFVTQKNEMGRSVLALEGDNAFLIGEGYTPEGQFPFVDKLNLATQKNKRIYQSELKDKKESLRDYDVAKDMLLTRIESPSEFPNYYFRNLKKKSLEQVTFFQNPFQALAKVHKEVISYKREDGLDLSGTLYLPADYDKSSGEKLPMILWAYPVEYKDKSSAAQNTKNANAFTYPSWGYPIYWVTRGYAVLNNASFPIVGEGDDEPNDSFRKQLVANGKAAIDAVDALGYIDRGRVAVGGHSYGAFMVANLLSHSDLFAAGIARSGAYNRTLTPFGFQREQRSYWEAPEVYYTMSPFMHAEKMKTPLLLTHGEADNNSGTYPLQSKRYFNALKGLGATTRLVMFPKESHGYRAKESILHLLWEQDQWLEKYVKNKGSKPE